MSINDSVTWPQQRSLTVVNESRDHIKHSNDTFIVFDEFRK